MFALLLVTVLGVGDADEGRGNVGRVTPASTAEREAPRFHAALGVVVAGGFTSFAKGLGVGVNAELGVVLRDVVTCSVRANVGTVVLSNVGALELGVDFAVGERFSIGVGAGVALLGSVFVADIPSALTVQGTVRGQVAISVRRAVDLARTMPVLFVELSPAVLVLDGRPSFSRFAFLAVLGAAWWWG